MKGENGEVCVDFFGAIDEYTEPIDICLTYNLVNIHKTAGNVNIFYLETDESPIKNWFERVTS